MGSTCPHDVTPHACVEFHFVCTCDAQVNKYYFWEWVSQRATQAPTTEQVTLWDSKDRALPRKLLEFQTTYMDSIQVRHYAKDAQVVTRILNATADEMDERLAIAVNQLVQKGEINWATEIGCYMLGTVDDNTGRVTTIKHRYSGLEA